MTGKRVSTSTPENSEAPRESRGDVGLVERFDALVFDSEVLHKDTPFRPSAKTSSPELASLAAQWLSADMKTLDKALAFDREGVLDEIKKLAASVLAQAEGTPRK